MPFKIRPVPQDLGSDKRSFNQGIQTDLSNANAQSFAI